MTPSGPTRRVTTREVDRDPAVVIRPNRPVGWHRPPHPRVRKFAMVQLAGRIEQHPEVRPVPVSRILLAGVMLAGVLAVLVARWWTGTGYVPVPLGLPDPGLLTS